MGRSLRLEWTPPYEENVQGVNGAPVTGYKVEVAARRFAQQRVSVGAPYTGGAYRLFFEGSRETATACLPWDAPAAALEVSPMSASRC